MPKITRRPGALTSVAVAALTLASQPAASQEQTAGAAATGDDIIVTARKRSETLMAVPVVATAVSAETLSNLQTNDLKSLATLVPGLSLGTSILSVGQLVSLRGVGTSALDPGVDASVSLNIDGLSLSQGLAYASGMFDVAQVEVLKGPQNLFFGKSSPGGVISLRTADPTDHFEAMLRGGYELDAHTRLFEGYVSGPLSDTIKVRIAGQYGKTDGFFFNTAVATPNSGAAGPSSDRLGGGHYYKIRGTLLFNPSDVFDARIKLNYVKDDIRNGGQLQNVVCPDGVNAPLGRYFVQPTDDCKLNRYVPSVDQNNAAFPAFAYPGNVNYERDGVPYNLTKQLFGSAELNYHLSPRLTLTSQTGYYKVDAQSLFNGTTASAAMGLFDVTNGFNREQITQELRLVSDFSGPLNFTVGGFVERSHFSDDVTIARNVAGFPLAATAAPTQVFVQKGFKYVAIRTESLYGQVLYKITPELELAAGARWTDERRRETGNFLNPVTGVTSDAVFARPKIQSKNVAPEVSLTYRPNSDMTVFASYKKGYKSGSFNVSTPPFNGENNAFDDEKVEGGEAGIKMRTVDRKLNFDMAGFYYKYSGLQVGANVQATNGVTVTRTVNAGAARSYGVEGSLVYRPVDRLNLRVAGLYNNTRYTSLNNIPCYGGQMISQGCNLLFNPAANGGIGGFTAQDRSGLPLIRAPRWSGNFGADYEFELDHDWRLIATSSNQWQSRSLVNLGYIYYQPSYLKADLSFTLKAPSNTWELALIGKNIGNTITTGNCSNGNRMAGNAGGEITGTNTSGIAGSDEVGCWTDTGRELWVRLTFKIG